METKKRRCFACTKIVVEPYVVNPDFCCTEPYIVLCESCINDDYILKVFKSVGYIAPGKPPMIDSMVWSNVEKYLLADQEIQDVLLSFGKLSVHWLNGFQVVVDIDSLDDRGCNFCELCHTMLNRNNVHRHTSYHVNICSGCWNRVFVALNSFAKQQAMLCFIMMVGEFYVGGSNPYATIFNMKGFKKLKNLLFENENFRFSAQNVKG